MVIRAVAVLLALALVPFAPVGPADASTAVGPRDPARAVHEVGPDTGGLERGIHFQEAQAHADDPVRFTPGDRVTVPLRLGNDSDAGSLPPARLSGAQMLQQETGEMPPRGTDGSASTESTVEPWSAPAMGLSREVFGFLPYWKLSDSETTLDYSVLSTIAYFGVGATGNGDLVKGTSTGWSGWTSSRMTDVINNAHLNGARVVLTVQRFSWTTAGADESTELLSDPFARQRLAIQIAAAVGDRGADGVNLDFEPIPSGQSANFVALTREVRAALDAQAPGYQLTVDTLPYLGEYDVVGLTADGAADAVFIMGYEYRWSGSTAGATAPLAGPRYDLGNTVSAYLAKVPADKVILGLPFYGRVWSTETELHPTVNRPQGTTYGYSGAVTYQWAVPRGLEHGRRYDHVEHAPWTAYRYQYCSSCPWTWRQLWYEDVESLGSKYDLAISSGLRGVGIWALGFDGLRPELKSVLRTKFLTTQARDTVPPTGSFSVDGSSAWIRSPRIRVSATSSDDTVGSGAAFLRLSNDPATTAAGVLSVGTTLHDGASHPFSLVDPAAGGSNAEGTRTVYAQWRDVAGNWSSVSSRSFRFDPTAPSGAVSVQNGASYTNSPTVTVSTSATDATSGTAEVRVSSSGATSGGLLTLGRTYPYTSSVRWSLTDTTYGGSSTQGARAVHVQWRDVAGNWSAVRSDSIVLDTAAPSGTVALDGPVPASGDTTVSLAVPATDATSGVASVRLSNGSSVTGGVLTSGTTYPYQTPVDWAFATDGSSGGTYTVYAQWRDRAGNWSAVSSTTFTTTGGSVTLPAGRLTLDGGAAYTRDATVTARLSAYSTAAEDADRIAAVRLSNRPETSGGRLTYGSESAYSSSFDWSLADATYGGSATNGQRTVYAQWRDAAGNWSSVSAARIVFDSVAPVVRAAAPELLRGWRMTESTVPVRLTWAGSDATTRIVGYQLQQSVDGGAWSDVSLARATQATRAVALRPWHAYRFRLRATDAAGNASAWATTASFLIRRRDDRSSTMTYTASWKDASVGSAYADTLKYSTVAGARAKYEFKGRQIAWVAATGPTRGVANVYLDGVKVESIDLWSETEQARKLVFTRTWATETVHALEIRVVGTSGRPRVDVDAVLVLRTP